MSKTQSILIIGGGFAGIRAALDLDKKLPKDAQITLISDKDYFEYYPALYRVVTGASPIEACVPLTVILGKTRVSVIVDPVTALDIDTRSVTTKSGKTYASDFLILGLGSQTSYFDLPGLPDLSFGFKSVHEALELKHHIHNLFLDHEHPTTAECVSHFHVVVVGGGASGVEIAGDLSAFLNELTTIHKIDPSLITIDLIESSPRLLPALDPRVSARILARLRKLGVNIFLNRSLVKEEVAEVYLKDMSLKAKTVVWTAGTRVHPLYQNIQGFSFNKKGRVMVDAQLQPTGKTNIFIVGDAADTPYAGLAQTALADGTFVAETIAARITGKREPKYTPKPTAFSIPVGTSWGAFAWGPIHIYGRVAYFLRHLIDFFFFAGIVPAGHLFKMFKEGFKYRSVDPLCPECTEK